MTEPTIAQKAPYATACRSRQDLLLVRLRGVQEPAVLRRLAQGLGFRPSFNAEKEGTAYLCGCKQSKNGAFCDGSHKSL